MLHMKIFTIIIFLLYIQLAASAQCNYLASFASDVDGSISPALSSNGKLFFSAVDSLHGRELWVTDGTTAGTHIVKDINPGIASGVNFYFRYHAYDFKGILFFQADNGNGTALWRSDGTKAGTWLVADMYIDNQDHYLSNFASTDSVLYFTADGETLWRSNGTAAGTRSLGYFTIVRELTTFRNNLYFSAASGNAGEELWKSNGANGNTALLKDINGVYGTSLPNHFHATSNALYFMATTSAGCELWKTTGSESGTQMVKDINPGNQDGVPGFYWYGNMSHIGNTVFFTANDGANGSQMWKSDGTDTGTVRVSYLAPGVSQYCDYPVVNKKVFYYTDEDSSSYRQYDPVTNATSVTGYPHYAYYPQTFLGSYLFYAGQDSMYGAEMWHSAGTPASTGRIQEISLVDNFYNKYLPGPNRIVGTTGSKLIFTVGRDPFRTGTPLYSYDTALAYTALAPSVLIPVALPYNRMHLVWKRINNASEYEVRYHSATGSWIKLKTALSYSGFKLDPGETYSLQVRAYCNNTWTNWSKEVIYSPSSVYHSYALNILADRAVDASTMHIYWLKSPEISKLQLRYRLADSSTWTKLSNSSGLVTLSNLLPSSFYYYEYRAYSSGYWGTWSGLYFYTPAATTIMAEKQAIKKDALQLVVWPNPTISKIHIQSKVPAGAYYTTTDALGNVLQTGTLKTNDIVLPASKKGLLTITVYKYDFTGSAKVLKF
jgi:ELWxxDGT repeat protein